MTEETVNGLMTEEIIHACDDAVAACQQEILAGKAVEDDGLEQRLLDSLTPMFLYPLALYQADMTAHLRGLELDKCLSAAVVRKDTERLIDNIAYHSDECRDLMLRDGLDLLVFYLERVVKLHDSKELVVSNDGAVDLHEALSVLGGSLLNLGQSWSDDDESRVDPLMEKLDDMTGFAREIRKLDRRNRTMTVALALVTVSLAVLLVNWLLPSGVIGDASTPLMVIGRIAFVACIVLMIPVLVSYVIDYRRDSRKAA